MSKGFKITLLIFLVVIVAGSIIAYNMFTKPNRDVANEQGLVVTASQLVADYQADENAANTRYLNQPVQVSGTISKVADNQEGVTTVLLSSNDAMTGVFCTLKQKDQTLKTNTNVVVKGICNGMLSDVRLGEAIIIK